MKWFQCKVSYEKTVENGAVTKVTEPYLVDALSYTEAEARITKEMQPYISGEFAIADIKRANYAELFDSEDMNADRWWECKIEYVSIDEIKGIEKRTPVRMLVKAGDIKDAIVKIESAMNSYMGDYWIKHIRETPILDIFPYIAELEPTQADE